MPRRDDPDPPDPGELHTQVQHRLIEELEASEYRNRHLLETLPEVILQCDEDGRLTYLNPAWRSLLGCEIRDSLGKRLVDFIAEEDAGEWPEFPGAGEPDRTRELRLRTSSGENRWFFVGLRTSRRGQHSGLLQDVSHRIRLEQQLRQSQKMEAIGRLAGGIAHDFNNLLTVIIGGTETALYSLAETNPGVREDLEAVIQAGERAADLTGQLLAFGRRQVMRFRAVRVADVLEDIQAILARLIESNIEIVTVDRCETGFARIDPTQFQQVIMNLAVNARDAMPTGGQLRFELSDTEMGNEPHLPQLSPGPYVVLSVTDTGTGIPAEELERIFEPFYTTKETGKGTGLGLATCYGIVHQSQGAIEVESRVGVGTTFRIFLPAAEPEPGDAA